MIRKIKGMIYRMNISGKLMTAFTMTLLVSFIVTMLMNMSINQRLSEIEQVYISNDHLNEISAALAGIQNSMQEYLDTRSSDSLTNYYNYEQTFQGLIENLNDEITDDRSGIMEKNIKGLAENYRQLATDTIEAKRARDISRYKTNFDEAAKTHKYLYSYIFSLNNVRFEVNSGNYESLANGLRMLERVTTLLNVVVALVNICLLRFLIGQIIRPLSELSKAADSVAAGDFTVPEIKVYNMDEVGVVTRAFNKMVVSIGEYLVRIRESIQKENQAKERELLMEASLKDAQLKYYQAQIHPHFLFNTLNAGAQMAMMEDAERTSSFIQHMSEFFRYSLKGPGNSVSLKDEIELVENYIYIMNVRFSGEIHYQKEIRCDVSGIHVPAMILQPLVENSINYGIRDIQGEGRILLIIEEEEQWYQIRVSDNGAGISPQRLAELKQGSLHSSGNEDDSNGIGLGNVMERLQLYYHRSGLMKVCSEGLGKGTTVSIRIPKEEIRRAESDV